MGMKASLRAELKEYAVELSEQREIYTVAKERYPNSRFPTAAMRAAEEIEYALNQAVDRVKQAWLDDLAHRRPWPEPKGDS